MKCMACRQYDLKKSPDDDAVKTTCAFEKASFNSDNWNCKTVDLVRDYFGEYGDDCGLSAVYRWREDQSIGMLDIPDIDWEPESDRDGAPLSLWVTWYKRRGRTEQMWLMYDDAPPRQPTEPEILMIMEAVKSRDEWNKKNREASVHLS